jgi:predicted transcriptional regulator
MEPSEFRRLQALARKRKTSVADLIRQAVREAYLRPQPDRGAIVDAILGMRIAMPDWASLKDDVERGHAGLP